MKDEIRMTFSNESQARAFFKWASSQNGFDTISEGIVDNQKEGYEDLPQCLGTCKEMDTHFYIDIE